MKRVWPLHPVSFLLSALLGISCLAATTTATAQDSILIRRQTLDAQSKYYGYSPVTLEQGSLLFSKAEPIRELQLHDIVTVVVNINSRFLSEGDVESRRQSQIDAILQDWIGLDGLSLRPDPQSDGDPRVRGSVNSQIRNESDLETRNSLNFTIAAKVIDVRPNGNLVIEARHTFQNNEEIWERSLTGIIRREDVAPDNKVESEDIADLRVYKREIGEVRDGYRRGWLQRLYQRFQLF